MIAQAASAFTPQREFQKQSKEICAETYVWQFAIYKDTRREEKRGEESKKWKGFEGQGEEGEGRAPNQICPRTPKYRVTSTLTAAFADDLKMS